MKLMCSPFKQLSSCLSLLSSIGEIPNSNSFTLNASEEKIRYGSDIAVFLIIIIKDEKKKKKMAGWQGGVRFMKGGDAYRGSERAN